MTETARTPQGSWKDLFWPRNRGDGWHTAPSLPDATAFVFDSNSVPRDLLRNLIDIPEEERRTKTRLYNRMARGELPPVQDSTTPALLVEHQDRDHDQDMVIESPGPIRRFKVKLLIKSVRKAEPPEMDPSWVL